MPTGVWGFNALKCGHVCRILGAIPYYPSTQLFGINWNEQLTIKARAPLDHFLRIKPWQYSGHWWESALRWCRNRQVRWWWGWARTTCRSWWWAGRRCPAVSGRWWIAQRHSWPGSAGRHHRRCGRRRPLPLSSRRSWCWSSHAPHSAGHTPRLTCTGVDRTGSGCAWSSGSAWCSLHSRTAAWAGREVPFKLNCDLRLPWRPQSPA